MKSLLLICISIFSSAALAKPILERQLFNSRNGESFTCVVHDNGKVVLSSDNNASSERSKTVTLQPDITKISSWISQLQADEKYKSVAKNAKGIEIVAPEKTTQYIQRGLKKYSVVDGKKKVAFYALKGYLPALRNGKANPSDKPGTLHYKLKNYQQLKGAVDLACKMAM